VFNLQLTKVSAHCIDVYIAKLQQYHPSIGEKTSLQYQVLSFQ